MEEVGGLREKGRQCVVSHSHILFYTVFLQAACLRAEPAAMSREEQQQPVFMAIDALDFPELHDESIPYMAFLKNCTRLLAAAGVRDFNMQVRQSLQLQRDRNALCQPGAPM